MTLTLDIPQSRSSWLGRLDARWKLASLLPAALLTALLRSWPLSLAALTGALILVVSARLPLRWYLARMAGLMLFLSLFLVWPIFFPDNSTGVWNWGWLAVDVPRLLHVIGILARAVAVVSLMLVLLATAPLPDTFKAAHALKVPGLIVHLLILTYRYLFVLGEEWRRLRLALRVRGFRNRAGWHSYRTIGQVAGSLLVRSHDRAERVGHAMRARGFDGRFRSRSDFRTCLQDVVFCVGVVAIAAGLMLCDWLAT